MPWSPGQPLYRMYIVRDGVKWYYSFTNDHAGQHIFADKPYFARNPPFRETLEGISRWMRLHGFRDTLHIESFVEHDSFGSTNYLHINIENGFTSREEAERFYRAEGLLH